jgi:hypothetical protein
VTTFRVLVECAPGLAFAGFGLHFLLTALVPSWREKGWRHWRYFGPANPGSSYNDNSWLVQLGFVRRLMPDAEGDWDVDTAVRIYLALGVLFSLIGIAEIIIAVQRAMT